MQKKSELLATSLLFNGLPAEQLSKIAAIAVGKHYPKGATIFHEGDPGIGFYLVANGKVKIFKTSFDGKEQILHIFGAGEPFGEVPVFYGSPFPANATTLSDAELYFFPRNEFVDLVTATPSLALNMLAVLALRLRRFAAQIENLSLKEVPGRLASHLRYLMEEQKRRDKVVLDIPKGQLASLLGTSAETLSRIFGKMSEDGLIRVEGKTIVILDPNGLQEH
ncbi:MAG: Crp/Fnr family transcriptional regulator [Desulfobulbus sp.]|jgi:CRP/FNR family transcriptional regulator|uniref:Crp/Fnr family transcriptional regulator n=1 Tax=Desulfobulbus sp. TaxID=895 RepID=UPI00284A34E6|nr:Crp/Fnr family transcriptional regulator [Desulfobulbus sp.]MDR2549803.1 Crp/Fnr family transcriptional regulator [Desulfobulbus sp.]